MNKRHQIARGNIQSSIVKSPSNRTSAQHSVGRPNQYNLSLTVDKIETNCVSDPSRPTGDMIDLIASGQNYGTGGGRSFASSKLRTRRRGRAFGKLFDS